MNLKYILTLDPSKVYSDVDLNDAEILNRALRLLYQAKLGQDKFEMRINLGSVPSIIIKTFVHIPKHDTSTRMSEILAHQNIIHRSTPE